MGFIVAFFGDISFFLVITHWIAGIIILFVFWPRFKGWLPKLNFALCVIVPLPVLIIGIIQGIILSNKLIAFLAEQVAIQTVAIFTGGAGEALEAGALGAEAAETGVAVAEAGGATAAEAGEIGAAAAEAGEAGTAAGEMAGGGAAAGGAETGAAGTGKAPAGTEGEIKPEKASERTTERGPEGEAQGKPSEEESARETLREKVKEGLATPEEQKQEEEEEESEEAELAMEAQPERPWEGDVTRHMEDVDENGNPRQAGGTAQKEQNKTERQLERRKNNVANIADKRFPPERKEPKLVIQDKEQKKEAAQQ